MNQRLDLFVALDRFDVLEVNEDERQRRQHHGEAKRQHQPETRVALSFGLHCGPEDTPGQARAVSSVSKKLLRVVKSAKILRQRTKDYTYLTLPAKLGYIKRPEAAPWSLP